MGAKLTAVQLDHFQRIENNETVPRGDTLKRLAIALGTSPDEIIDWKRQEDRNYLLLMNLSTLSFLFFPILGVIIPLIMWIFKKEKLKHVDELGKSILNFQISWTLLLSISWILLFLGSFFKITSTWSIGLSWVILSVGVLYIFNFLIIIINSIRIHNKKQFVYKPAFRLLK